MKKTSRLLSLVLAILLIAGSLVVAIPVSAEETVATYTGPNITDHSGGYEHYDRTVSEYRYDFSMDRLGYYATDSAISMGNRATAYIEDGTLRVKDGMKFDFGSAIGLGDDYGLEEGYLSFKLQRTEGKAYLGLRTSMVSCEITDRGIWFEFDGSDKMKIYEPESNIEAIVDMPIDIAEEKTFTVHEGLDTITFSSGDTVIAKITYDKAGHLAICNSQGEVLAETDKCELYPTGYFQLTLDDVTGYLDDIVFTNVEHKRKINELEDVRIIDYSTWTATDAIDRTVATNAEAKDPVDNRYVGVFYFLCCIGAGKVVSDNTKDYLQYGAEGIKQRIEERAGEAYWAEPYFGYYLNTDTWVYRKHAYMLEAAGVDFIFLDVSNGEVFESGHMALFDTWLQMRKEGIDTPQIVFFNGDTPKFMKNNMDKLFTTVYSDENWDKYRELFFEWEGKPLVFGNMSTTSGALKDKINEKFTVRGNWAWQNQDGYWSWLQEYTYERRYAELTNGGWGRDENGKKESLSISLGHHPTTNKGRSFVNGKQPNNGLGDFEFSSVERAGLGLNLESQFNAVQWLIAREVKANDPFALLITGWNEWIAGGFTHETEQQIANGTCLVTYTDQFNIEFSRDGEPMRNQDGYGIGDNYYYQMIDYIRKYKGIDEAPVADHQESVNIYDVSSWDKVELKYMDNIYDTELRNTISYNPHYRYINNTGRNDIEYAKISQDENALYFLVKTSHDIVIDDDENWMNLYINIDGDHATGWEGFDYVLNRARDSYVVTVDKFKDNTFETETVGGAYYYLDGEYMSIRMSKDVMGITGKVANMTFKWADNADIKGDIMSFMDLGDTAPDNRFAFQYICEEYTTKYIEKTELAYDSVEKDTSKYSVAKPDQEGNISVEDVKVDVTFDINKLIPGARIENTPMGQYFEYAGGNDASSATVGTFMGEQIIRVTGYSDIRTWNDVEGPYEFSTDIRLTAYGDTAVYMRGEMPGAYTPINPCNFNINQIFNYYEVDWYTQNGGKIYGKTSTAGSGIGIYPGENDITVRIKRYAEDGLGVASASYTFPYTESFSPSETGWLNLRCVDDDNKLSIYFNDTLMCYVKFENPGVTYESDGTGQEYYGKVTLCDVDGTEVLVVENTRVNSQGSQIAFAGRMQNFAIKNVHIQYDSQTANGSVNTYAMTEIKETVSYTPTSSFAELDLGENVVEPEKEVETDSGNSSENESGTDAGEKGKGCKSAIGIMTIVGTALIGYAFMASNKKKK